MVHPPHDEAFEIAEIAWDLKRQDLPLAFGEELVATGEPRQHEVAFGGMIALADDVLVRSIDARPKRRLLEHAHLRVAQRADPLQLSDEGMRHER
jgi:hypothetical protein